MVLVLVLAELGSDKDTLPGLHCVYADKRSTLAELTNRAVGVFILSAVSSVVILSDKRWDKRTAHICISISGCLLSILLLSKIFAVSGLPNKGFWRPFKCIFCKLIMVIFNCGIMLKTCLSCACFFNLSGWIRPFVIGRGSSSALVHLKQLYFTGILAKTFVGFFPFFCGTFPGFSP